MDVCAEERERFTCSEQHHSDRSVETSPGADAHGHQAHQEREKNEASST